MIKKIKSNCKINIGLNVEGVLENGYHLLDMVMVPIDLSDVLTIDFKEKEGHKLIIRTTDPRIPTDERNILYKVYKKFFEQVDFPPQEIEVHLEKNIPSQAGLGGGSSNGAFFLKELNSYYNNVFSLEELIDMGKEIGADIPFFLINKSSRVRGIGEKIEIFENNLDMEIVLIKPKFGISTPEAFKSFDTLPQEFKNKKANILNIIKGVFENNLYIIVQDIKNQLELGLLRKNENIKKIRSRLETISGHNFFMSGSGSTYFTFVKKEDKDELVLKLKSYLEECEIYTSKFIR